MSSARYVAWLAWRRLRRPDSGALTTALGLAVAAAMLAAVSSGATVATDRATAHAIDRIPPSARSVRAVWFGVPAGSSEKLPVLDREAGAALAELELEGPTRLVLVRESTVAGRFVGLAGVDGLEPHVTVRSGRLPRECTAARCEVLRLRGAGSLPDAPGLRIVQVGTGTLRSQQLFGDFLEPTDSAAADARVATSVRESGRYHRPAPAPLVVAEGVDALAASPVLARTYRSYAWVWPIAPGAPRLWDVDGVVDRIDQARAALSARSDGFAVTGPQEELRAAERAAEVARTRLLLVGGEGAMLLLAFTVLAARGLRRDFEGTRRRLTWYGAQRWQLGLLVGIESAVAAGAGVLGGWLVGAAVGASAAELAGAPPSDVLRESVASAGGIALAAALALVSAGLIALTMALRSREGAHLGAPEIAAGTAVLIVGIALLGGAADESRLAEREGPALLLLLVPGLVALAAGIVVARVLPHFAALVAARSWGSARARLAAAGLARGHGAAVATAAFLTIAFALALHAEGYRATLARGEREQAAFQVPLDVVVREDLRKLERVFAAAPLERFRALVRPGGDAYPVLRVTGGAGRAERVSGVTVLGLDSQPIRQLGVWRSEWAEGRTAREAASLVAPPRRVVLRGLDLRNGEIVLRVSPTVVSFAAVIERGDGDFRRIELGDTDSRTARTLRRRVPRGSRLVSLEVIPPPRLIEGGADAGVALAGSVRLAGPLAGELGSWLGVDGVEVRPGGAGAELGYTLTPLRTAHVRAPQVTDSQPPEVLVTERLAELVGGPGGTLPLQIGGERVPVRVAGVVTRFPGAEGEIVVGDRGALQTAINTASPGAARENEVWLDVPDSRLGDATAALSRPPFGALMTVVRESLEADARRDPLARGTLLALVAAALVALVLAAVGLALAVRSDVRDDRGEHYDLEAQGASASFLRDVVRYRALALSFVGVVAGSLIGTALLLLVTRVVAVTARGGAPEPPLAASLEPLVVLGGLAAYVVLAALLVGASTRSAFAGERGPTYRGGG